jgi:hypothetical protein
MNEAPTAPDELISRHFDGPLSPPEHQRLADALLTDPVVRADFVATARLHAGLEALAPPQPLVRKRPMLRWLATAGIAAALVAAGSLVFLKDNDGFVTRITLEDMDASLEAKLEESKPTRLTKRVLKSPASALTQGAGAIILPEFLSRYYVNVSPHGLTVPQALAQLEEAIKFENALKRPELDRLTFSASASFDPGSDDPVVFMPRKGPLTVPEYVEICRLYRSVIQNPESIHQSPPPLAVTLESMSGPLEVKEFRVPPDFLGFHASETSFPEGNAAAARLARSFGIRLTGDESATFSSQLSTVTVCATPGKLDQIASRLDHSFQSIIHQVFITTKYLKVPRALLPAGFEEESGLVLDADALQLYLDLVAREKSAAVVTAPSVIVRNNQQSKIEVIQQLVSGKNIEIGHVGVSQGILTSLCGELIRVEGVVEFGVLTGMELPGDFNRLRLSDAGVTGLPKYFKTEYELWLPDRSTGLFVVESPQEEGFVTLICLTPTLIDQAGETLQTKAENHKKRIQQQEDLRELAIRSESKGQVPLRAQPAGSGHDLYLIAIPVDSHPGFVVNPNAMDKGLIDARGFAKGSNIVCPYTGSALVIP